MTDEKLMIRAKEPFDPGKMKCWIGDGTIWDKFKNGDTGDFTVTLKQNVKIIGGYDIGIDHQDKTYFGMPADPANNPLYKDVKFNTVRIPEAVSMFHCVNCYGHFLLEFLPMFVALDYLKAMDERFETMPVLMPQLPLNWQLEAVAHLEKNDFYTTCNYGNLYEVEKLWSVSRPHRSLIPKWVPAFLKKAFIKNERLKPTRKLFISRKLVPAASRQIINYDEVLPIVKKHGFEEIHPQKMGIFEQAELYNQASAVFGVHGSGNLNFIFCQEGQKLIEIMPDNWSCQYGMSVAAANNGFYHFLRLKGEQLSNFDVDCKMLDEVLGQI